MLCVGAERAEQRGVDVIAVPRGRVRGGVALIYDVTYGKLKRSCTV